MQIALDLDKHLIKEPDITGFPLSMLNIIDIILTEFQTPLTILAGCSMTPTNESLSFIY